MARPLLYVAYPMRLDLGAANAIQTLNTVRELERLMPDMRLVIPRWLNEPSAFEALQSAIHLPRPAVNKLSRLLPWGGWSYIERTLYSLALTLLLSVLRLAGRGYRVLYVRDTVCAAWLALLRPLHGGTVVYEVHDLEADHPSKVSRWPRALWGRFLPWLDRMALRRSQRLVSLTHTFKAWALEHDYGRNETVAVIPDAFDPDLYYPVDMQEARRAIGMADNAFVIGYSGLTFAYRGLETLVRAFARVSKEVDGARLALVGGRPDEVEELKRLASDLRIPPGALLFTGRLSQPEAAAYVRASDLLVVPDTVTAMTASPLKLFEYMAVGRPLICKDMPALREVVDESAAVFFQAGDADDLAGAIASLAADPERRDAMGRSARRLAERYTYAARAASIAEVVRASS